MGSCNFSDLTGFSFVQLNHSASEGGIITLNNTDYYKKLIRLRSHGINKNDDPYLIPKQSMTGTNENPWYYEMQSSFNFTTDIQCALANSQLKN